MLMLLVSQIFSYSEQKNSLIVYHYHHLHTAHPSRHLCASRNHLLAMNFALHTGHADFLDIFDHSSPPQGLFENGEGSY